MSEPRPFPHDYYEKYGIIQNFFPYFKTYKLTIAFVDPLNVPRYKRLENEYAAYKVKVKTDQDAREKERRQLAAENVCLYVLCQLLMKFIFKFVLRELKYVKPDLLTGLLATLSFCPERARTSQ